MENSEKEFERALTVVMKSFYDAQMSEQIKRGLRLSNKNKQRLKNIKRLKRDKSSKPNSK